MPLWLVVLGGCSSPEQAEEEAAQAAAERAAARAQGAQQQQQSNNTPSLLDELGGRVKSARKPIPAAPVKPAKKGEPKRREGKLTLDMV